MNENNIQHQYKIRNKVQVYIEGLKDLIEHYFLTTYIH